VNESLLIYIACVLWVGVLVVTLTTLTEGVSKSRFRSLTIEKPSRVFGMFQILGVSIMSALETALARLNTFVRDVVAQLGVARDTNAVQTEKLAELQAKLDAALSDDAEDKAAIAALQSEITSLQDAVAAQINAAIDSLENAPAAEDVVADEVVEDEVSDELVVVEDEVPAEDKPAE